MARLCFSCGGSFEVNEGPTHKYMLSSPGCWKAYGELLAREYENPLLFGAVHRLTVDAYALQHPGDPSDRRATQSVWIHFSALYLALEKGVSHASLPAIMRKLTSKTFPPLPPAPQSFSITLADVVAEEDNDYIRSVQRWAESAYSAWEPLNCEVGRFLADL